jgi:hypothetical protein
VAKTTKKDCTLQSYIFTDTKGDEIQATAFNKVAENLDKIIQEGGIYEIRKVNIQLAERAFNATKCDYKLVFNESVQINPAPDNGKFGGVKLSVIPLDKIVDFPIGKIIDVFGFVLEDKGYQEITTKNEKTLKLQKVTIGDDTLSKIEITFWEPIASPDISYSFGDLIAVKNCRVKEFNGRKTLSSMDSTEVKRSLDSESDSRLRKFFDEHQNENEYKDIQGEIISTGTNRAPAELAFIKEILNTFEDNIEYKDRLVYEINGTVTKLNHSERNFYTGCAKCHKKMETDVCTYCSGTEKKVIFTLSVNVRDASSFFWVDLFGDVAEKFLGVKGEVDPNFYIYICFGQSNMEGNAQWEAQDVGNVDPRFQMLATCNFTSPKRTLGEWYTAECPIVSPVGKLGPSDYFGRTMVKELPDKKVGVIAVAMGGSPIEMFDKDLYEQKYKDNYNEWWAQIARNYYGENPYGRIIEMAKKAQQVGVIKGILLHQGCSNCGDPNWPGMVKKIYKDMLSDLGLRAADVPILSAKWSIRAKHRKAVVVNHITYKLIAFQKSFLQVMWYQPKDFPGMVKTPGTSRLQATAPWESAMPRRFWTSWTILKNTPRHIPLTSG